MHHNIIQQCTVICMTANNNEPISLLLFFALAYIHFYKTMMIALKSMRMHVHIYFSTTAKKLYYFDDENRKMTIPLMICIIMYRQLLLCVSLLDMHVPEVNMWLCRC